MSNEDGSSCADEFMGDSEAITKPQRRKPGRKPNPASPALRKAQNRAAQRAFRERKERHLRDLEDTIKSLRESQYQSVLRFQTEIRHLHSLIESLETENCYLKEVAYTFENALNQVNGDSEATEKLKEAVMMSIPARAPQPAASSFSTQTDDLLALMQKQAYPNHKQQYDMRTMSPCGSSDGYDELALPTPTSSEEVSSSSGDSPPSVAYATSPLPYVADEFSLDVKPIPAMITSGEYDSASASYAPAFTTVSLSPSLSPALARETQQRQGEIDPSLLSDMFLQGLAPDSAFTRQQSDNCNYATVAGPIGTTPLSKCTLQMFQLAILVGSPDGRPLKPITRFPLTEEQLLILSMPHDPQIDFIPCLHLRSKMIEFRHTYDLDELIDMVVQKAKCHGDPRDPDSWELPEEFFTRFRYLSIGYSKAKSRLYRTHGRIPEGYLRPPTLPSTSSGIYTIS